MQRTVGLERGGGYIVWRGEVRRDTEIRKGRLLYEKKKRTTKKKNNNKEKTIVGRLSGLLAHFIIPLAKTIFFLAIR